MTTNYGGGASSNEADDGVCRLRESDAIESLKGVNIKNFRLRNSTTKKKANFIDTPTYQLLMFAFCCCLSAASCLFVCFARWLGARVKPDDVSVGAGLISGCHCLFLRELLLRFIDVDVDCGVWRWEREAGPSRHATKGNQFFFVLLDRLHASLDSSRIFLFFRFHFSRWRRENDDWNARFRINERIYWDEAKVMINTPARSGTASLHYSSLNELCPT